MAEFEDNFPDWRKQVESTTFYSGGTGDIGGGQFTVLTRPGIDYVVKIPKKDPRWLEGYTLVEGQAPELAIPFLRVQDLALNIDRIKKRIPEVIVQQKVPVVHESLEDSFRKGDVDQILHLIHGTAQSDIELFKKGVFIPDPDFGNYGIDRDGTVKCLDLGSARNDVGGDETYSGLCFVRARSHYRSFFELKYLEQTFKLSDLSFSTIYAQEVGITPRDTNLENLLDPRTPSFNSALAISTARIGHDEFVQRAPKGAPYELNEEVIRHLPAYFGLN